MIEIASQRSAAGIGGRRTRPYDYQSVRRQIRQPIPHQVAQPALDGIAHHSGPNRAIHDKSHSGVRRWGNTIAALLGESVDDEAGSAATVTPANRPSEVLRPAHPVGSTEHHGLRLGLARSSGCELGAALAPTVRHDRPACAGAHPQPEAVLTSTTTDIGLEGALHGRLLRDSQTNTCGSGATTCTVEP